MTDNCPQCGGTVESISDCFTGSSAALDNFDEVEAELTERGALSDTHPLVEKHDIDPDDPVLDGVDLGEGPYVCDPIVTTETWCVDCEFSERTWVPVQVSDAAGGGR